MGKLFSNNNPEIFEKLVTPLEAKLFKTAIAILKNNDDAQDAIQETLVSAYRNFESLKDEKYFSTWITRILINKCYDLLKERKKVAYLNNKMEVDENAIFYDTYKSESIVEKILEQLPEDLKIISILYYYDNFSVKEISQMLKIPEGTVKSRLSRARDKIYELLKGEEGDSIE